MDSKQEPQEFLLPNHGSTDYFDLLTNATGDLNYSRYSQLTNAVLVGLFGCSMFVHLWQGLREKSRVFVVMMVLGTAGEMIGHLARMSAKEDAFGSLRILIQLLSLSAAPALLASGLFVVLVHRIVMLGYQSSRRVRIGVYTWIFATSAVQTVFLQAATILSTASSERLKISGAICQVAMLVAQFSMVKELVCLTRQRKFDDDSKQFLFPIVIASAAFFIRGIYQICVAVIDPSYPIVQDEFFLINFDSCMCLVVAVVFNFYYPRHLLDNQKPELTKLPRFEEKEDALA